MDSSVDLSQQEKAIQRKSRRSFVMVCLAFIVPIVLAKLALEQQWFNYGVTNQGQLVENELHLSDLRLSYLHDDLPEIQKPWLLIYNLPADCQQQCIQLFNSLNNTYIALGKEVKRVNLVGVKNNTFSAKQQTLIDIKRWTLVEPDRQVSIPAELTDVFIVDPLGNVVLMHQPPQAVEQLPAFGKAIVADFKTLLKLSRIG